MIKNILDECNFDMNNFLFKNIKKEKNTDNNEITDKDNTDIEQSDIIEENIYNCSEINEKNIKYKHLNQYLICEENNYYNLSIIIFYK